MPDDGFDGSLRVFPLSSSPNQNRHFNLKGLRRVYLNCTKVSITNGQPNGKNIELGHYESKETSLV